MRQGTDREVEQDREKRVTSVTSGTRGGGRLAVLTALGGFLRGRRRRRRHTGPEHVSSILPDVLAGLWRQSERAASGALPKKSAGPSGIVLPSKQAKA